MSIRRVYIRATIKLASPLHVGSGEEDSVATRLLAFINRNQQPPFADFAACRAALKVGDEPKGRYQRTYRHAGRAAIPASTLRGIWRRALGDKACLGVYFGPSATDRGHLAAGWLRLRDLELRPDSLNLRTDRYPLPDTVACTAVTQGIGIDPITGSVIDDRLWSYEYVPAGACFELNAEILPPPDRSPTTKELEALLGALLRVGESPELALGHATSKGLGLAQVTIDQVSVLDDAALKSWLEGKGVDARPQANPNPSLANLAHAAAADTGVDLDLRFPFGLLAGEPMLSQPKRKSARLEDRRGTEVNANQQYARDADGRPMIRGSSIKGLLRAHATRILVTRLLPTTPGEIRAAKQRASEALQNMFGNHRQKAALAISDARWLSSEAREQTNWRSFVAVDRFTGGAADQKLYDALMANACTLRLRVTQLRPLAAWERGLLLHVLRDAMDGDLALGWGKSKGLGRFEVVCAKSGTTKLTSTSELRTHAQSSPERRAELEAFDANVAELAAALTAKAGD